MFSRANLDPAVAPIGHDNVSVGIHSHACRSVELTIPLSVGAEFKQELPICVVHLPEDSTGKRNGG